MGLGKLQTGQLEQILKGMLKQVAGAILHFHEKKIIHRDLKPSNIMMILDKPYINDFDTILNRLLVATKCGTGMFMAPEVNNTPFGTAYDVKADVWSFGVTMYNLATNDFPFTEDQIKESNYELSKNKSVNLMSRNFLDLVKATLTINPVDRLDMNAVLEHAWFR